MIDISSIYRGTKWYILIKARLTFNTRFSQGPRGSYSEGKAGFVARIRVARWVISLFDRLASSCPHGRCMDVSRGRCSNLARRSCVFECVFAIPLS